VRWTLWTAADDGRPLELRIDAGGWTRKRETVTWDVYELLSGPEHDQLVTVRGAHPSARVVRNAAAQQAAIERLFPDHEAEPAASREDHE